jgi:transcriptional regulator with XRE-family HTH domain
MEINKDMAVRFASIREKMGVKQAEFAEVIGVSRPTVAGLEKGHSNITERNIKAVCQAYNISEEWLKTGQGSMFNPPSGQSELKNEEERELIRMFRILTADTKRMVVEIVRKFTGTSEIEDASADKADGNSDNGQNTDKGLRKGA